MLNDLHASSPDAWRIACLRYFNPVGAHPSGRIWENPLGIPNNLFPFVSQVAVGRRDQLQVFGGDWPTPDGTCVHDYIHAMDHAEGHRAAPVYLLATAPQLLTLNLGSGQGQSVLEVVQAMEAARGRSIPYAITHRRPGDAAISVADPSQAAQLRLAHPTRVSQTSADTAGLGRSTPRDMTEPAESLPTSTPIRSSEPLLWCNGKAFQNKNSSNIIACVWSAVVCPRICRNKTIISSRHSSSGPTQDTTTNKG